MAIARDEDWFLQIGFLRWDAPMAGGGSSWLNWFTKVYTRSDFIHAAIYLPRFTRGMLREIQEDGEDVPPLEEQPRLCDVSSTSNHVAFYEGRKFSREGWTFVDIPATRRQYADVYAFCVRQAQKRATFNWRGFYTFWLPRRLRMRTPNSWFCSALATAALMSADIMIAPQIPSPHDVDPARLYSLLTREGTVAGVGVGLHPGNYKGSASIAFDV
jgi:hypothetical protein